MESSGGSATAGRLDLTSAARLTAVEALRALASTGGGLTPAEAGTRLRQSGPNSLQTHSVRALAVFVGQLRSPHAKLTRCRPLDDRRGLQPDAAAGVGFLQHAQRLIRLARFCEPNDDHVLLCHCCSLRSCIDDDSNLSRLDANPVPR